MIATIEHIASILGRDAFLAACCGLAVAALALLITRIPVLSATTRHAVWMLAIVALGAMPLAAIGQSALASRVVDHPTAAQAATFDEAQAVADRAFAPVPNGLLQRVVVKLGRSHPRIARAVVASARPQWPSLRNHPRTAYALRFVPVAFLATWLVGALVGLGTLTASLLRVVGLKRRSSPLSEELSTQLPWLTEGAGREIMLRLSFEIETPVAVGFRRPVVLIPTELVDEHGLGQIEELVQHEYAHLRRYDDWTNLVQRVVERLFWWNPIVGMVGRRIALEREIAADDCVVAAGAAPQRYAQSLWRLAREMRMPEHSAVAPGALFTRKQISIRIERLLDEHRNAVPRISPAAAFAAAGLALVGIVAVVSAAPAFEITRELPPLAEAAPPAETAQPLPEPSTPAVRFILVRDPSPAPAASPARPVVRRVTVVATVTPLANATAGPHERKTIAYSYTVESSEPGTASPPAVPSPPPAVAANDVRTAREQIARASKTLAEAAVRDAMGATIESTDLEGVPMRTLLEACGGCNFANVDFHGMDLHGVHFHGLDLSEVDFRGANLRGTQFAGANCSEARFDDADLRDADFAGSNLQDASFDDARLDGAHFAGGRPQH
jgi:beta-lactamase regulating signal transducer with metallopeptidase domain